MALPVASPANADWNGTYLGVYSGLISSGGTIIPIGGVQGGFTLSRGATVFGIQGEFGAVVQSGVLIGDVGLSGQFGVTVGEKGLLYGVAGVSAFYGPGALLPHYSFGMGIEFPVGPNGASVFLEPRAFGVFGSGCCLVQVRAGVNWRP
jgi:hypothetical protein